MVVWMAEAPVYREKLGLNERSAYFYKNAWFGWLGRLQKRLVWMAGTVLYSTVQYCTVLYRIPWNSMESMEYHGIHGIPWNPWIPWIPWNSMDSMDSKIRSV